MTTDINSAKNIELTGIRIYPNPMNYISEASDNTKACDIVFRYDSGGAWTFLSAQPKEQGKSVRCKLN